jgi:EAL domain-containing protein (putative c-di-GMP-specific phosphodiesterase class I)
LQQADFMVRLEAALARHPTVLPDRLQMEVLETTALEDIEQVSSVIRSCRELGVTFALDDFGTGYSSLIYLKRLPVSQIKVDQTFVRGMVNDVDDLAILQGVLALARAFRLEVIAEGVETEEHGEALLRLGYELAQGFCIARPMPAIELPGWCAMWETKPRWRDVQTIGQDDK